jgi:prolyl 4-hydroxylase
MSEAEYRVKIGPWVRHRLEKNPAAFRIPSDDLDIFIVRDFLPEADCTSLVKQIDEGCEPSVVLLPTGDPDYRTSHSCNMNPRDPVIMAFEARLQALLGIAPALGEAMQGQRYAVGQQFKPHFDFFYPDQPYWPAMAAGGGQRTLTAMAFLNQPDAGGETFFPNAGVKVAPRTGNLLVWNNLDAAGEPNENTLHQGMPVAAGLKYVITKWHRERPWSSIDVPTYGPWNARGSD